MNRSLLIMFLVIANFHAFAHNFDSKEVIKRMNEICKKPNNIETTKNKKEIYELYIAINVLIDINQIEKISKHSAYNNYLNSLLNATDWTVEDYEKNIMFSAYVIGLMNKNELLMDQIGENFNLHEVSVMLSRMDALKKRLESK